MPTRRQRSIEYLTRRGLTVKEASTFADAYTYRQVRELPYFRDMLRNRQLYVNNQKYRGKSPAQIKKRLTSLYPNAWNLLRGYRKASVSKGDYKEPKRIKKRSVTNDELVRLGLTRAKYRLSK